MRFDPTRDEAMTDDRMALKARIEKGSDTELLSEILASSPFG